MTIHEKDRAELASEAGFTGTLLELLDWIEAALTYGAMRREQVVDTFGRDVLRVELVTAGYSSDEHLLHRLSQSIFMRSSWRSTHAGGLYVYEFNQSWLDKTEPLPWLTPEDSDPFETIARARRVRVIGADGSETVFPFEFGVELFFRELERDIIAPDGELVIQPLGPSEWDQLVAEASRNGESS